MRERDGNGTQFRSVGREPPDTLLNMVLGTGLTMGTVSAATSSAPHAIEVQPAAGAAALVLAVVTAAFVIATLRLSRLTKIVPAGATMELRSESPAVVDLLTGGFTVEDDAVPATVVDLAARGWFTIEDYGDDTIVRTRSVRPSGDTLQPYEQRVLSHIEQHAIDGVVPTRVLTTGQKQRAKRWFRGFSHEVIHHAQQLGLCTRRWGWLQIAVVWALSVLAAVPAIVVFDTAGESPDVADWASLGNVLAGLAIVVSLLLVVVAVWVGRVDAQKDTPAGVEAAAHWMGVRDFYRNTGDFETKSAASVAIWDHHLAYATALGLAQRVHRQIPFDSEHDRHAWSRATGQWRRVNVRYRTVRPGWGRHPFFVMFTSALTVAVFGALTWVAWNVADATWKHYYEDYLVVTPNQERWINLVAIAVAVLAVTVTTRAAVRFLFGCADLFRRRTVEGELVRAREFGGGDDSDPSYHLAIDTATPNAPVARDTVDTILAYRVHRGIYAQVTQGARVRVRVSPLIGYVASIETLVPAPEHARQAEPPNAVAATVGKLFNPAGGVLTGAVGGVIAGLLANQQARLTPEQLDAVGPDGRTVREVIAASQAELGAALGTSTPGAVPPPPPGGPRFRIVDPPA